MEKPSIWTGPTGTIQVPEAVVKTMMHWLTDSVADQLLNSYWPASGPIKVTEEDIKRYYSVHPDELDFVLAQTAQAHKLNSDSLIMDVLEEWVRDKYNIAY